ncbi:nucleotide exchange factor GrpE [Psychromonas sp. 14N.309.X.WAT.B.A12]|jgi:molecular chaperone GrpE|uniref:nucleotide exchange factor GrpE n=1 Tax=unclassified Psychromonas TaxID=2614957 RepID=UPI0025B0B0C5|nr:nucleotide exchange factor GrpE [Psychromonas sp. 14N.309.X.WAT.B.A12]MDN2664967.1 nucleotide exchange factor GrpE [Psychromonas sp. 14N.309.X.WAT.B.A12]
MSEEQKNTVEEAIETVLGEEAVEQEAVEGTLETGDEQSALIEELTKKLAAAEEEIKEQKDLVIRAQAFSQNEIRKAGIDAENRRKSVLKTFANALTPVVDHLELAIQHADKENETLKPMVDGVEMTLTELLKAISSIGIQQIDPMGETLNPEKHQAMSMQVVEGVPANQVVAVMQKGYELSGGQIIRPAMVVVSKEA